MKAYLKDKNKQIFNIQRSQLVDLHQMAALFVDIAPANIIYSNSYLSDFSNLGSIKQILKSKGIQAEEEVRVFLNCYMLLNDLTRILRIRGKLSNVQSPNCPFGN